MCFLPWQLLPLLLTILILALNSSSVIFSSQRFKIYVLVAQERVVCAHQQLLNRPERYFFLRSCSGERCDDKLKDPTLISKLHRKLSLCTWSGMFNLPKCDLITPQSSEPLQTKLVKTRTTTNYRVEVSAPMLTPPIYDSTNQKKGKLIAITAGGTGSAIIVTLIVAGVYLCLLHLKTFTRRPSEEGTSEPSPDVQRERGRQSPLQEILSPYESEPLMQLTLKELEVATSNFSNSHFIGEGRFGLVYKGLLQDGSIVAIKCRQRGPSRDFIQVVENIGHIRHRHIVKLVGYCQERHRQFLVYDYQPNGTVQNHLYNTEGSSSGRLDIRQRLSIAIGAAKGLEFLHGLVPPLLHMNFKTSNVLLDGNYSAKIADLGLCKVLTGTSQACSSSARNNFLDPEMNASNEFSEKSDVYAFGVFLLELVSGREAYERNQREQYLDLVEKAKRMSNPDGFLDKTMRENVKETLLQVMKVALQCVETSTRRPGMGEVVKQLELIQEKEIGYHQGAVVGEEISIVTLGSELFK